MKRISPTGAGAGGTQGTTATQEEGVKQAIDGNATGDIPDASLLADETDAGDATDVIDGVAQTDPALVETDEQRLQREFAEGQGSTGSNHDELILSTLEELGYPRDGGPIDASPTEKALFALRGVSSDRDALQQELASLKLGAAGEADPQDGASVQTRIAEGQRLVAAEAEIDRLKGALADARKETKAAKATSRGEKSKAPRKIGEMDESLSGGELREAIDDAEEVQIVFSDGKHEIIGIPPVNVDDATGWREHLQGLMLKDNVDIAGPAMGQTSFGIDGYALLIDGKQVAYRKRSDQLNVGPNQTVRLTDDIVF